jgi:hypothetical protein
MLARAALLGLEDRRRLRGPEHRRERLRGVLRVQVLRVDVARRVRRARGPPAAGDEDVLLDGGGEDAEEGVVDVLADEVDAAGGAGDVGRGVAKAGGVLGREGVVAGTGVGSEGRLCAAGGWEGVRFAGSDLGHGVGVEDGGEDGDGFLCSHCGKRVEILLKARGSSALNQPSLCRRESRSTQCTHLKLNEDGCPCCSQVAKRSARTRPRTHVGSHRSPSSGQKRAVAISKKVKSRFGKIWRADN